MVLHYYREDVAEAAAALEGHLSSCASCAARWHEITATLALADADGVPDPGDDFPARVWAAIRPRLDARPARRSLRSIAILTTLAASLLLAVGSGATWIRLAHPASQAVRITNAAPGADIANTADASPAAGSADPRERVLLSALTDHFSRTEMLLVELLNGPDAAPGPLEFERASADDLVASGRLYRATAEQTGDVQFASVLDDLESVLVEVARRSGRMQPGDVSSLRTRIRDDALLFKVRAVTTEIHDRQQTWRR